MASYQQRGKKSWFLVVEASEGATKRGRKTKTIRVEDDALLKSPKKLKEYLDTELLKFKIGVESGEYITPEKMLFESFLDIWEKRFVSKHLAETTAYNYRYHTKKRIRPHFKGKQIDKIKTLHIVEFLDDLLDVTGTATVMYVYRVLCSIFSKAVEWNTIKNDPMDGVDKPKDNPKEMEVYDENEVEKLLIALEHENIRFRILVSLALTTGMRRAEILGLEWKHIDLENGIIDIKQTIPMFKNGEPVIKGPKRKSSIRKIVIPSSMIAELRIYQAHMLKKRSDSETPWEGGKYYFLFARDNGIPLYPKTIGDLWRDFHKKIDGLKYIRFHDLRHTSATLLINRGIHAKIISSRLGHSKITTTMNVYGHVIESADRAAADAFNDIFGPKKPKQQKKTR